MFHWIMPSLVLLAVLGLSYLARPKTTPVKISFTAWCVSLQFFIIGMLGVGLIHTHLGCPYLLGDCYVDGYPRWLEYIQLALVFYVYAWWASVIVQTARNFFQAAVRG